MSATGVAWVGLGANIPPLMERLARLRDLLETGGIRITRASSEMRTAALTLPDQGPQPDYLNQVVVLQAPRPLLPREWLRHCKSAEIAAGRRPAERWGPRLADADVLLLGANGEIDVGEPDLVVPHRELPNRPFLHQLLGEIDPALARRYAVPSRE